METRRKQKDRNKEESVVVRNLSKRFKLGFKKKKNLLSTVLSFFSGIESKKDFWALKDVSFNADVGENIGIIGRNGSGKTTLLMAVAGIYQLDQGRAITNGRVMLLSGMSNGLRSRLTVRENIYLVGSILGLGQKDIQAKFKDIIEFAGLENFIETKVYQLSSGMKSRLAFSTTMHCLEHSRPDVLLLDEVFSGGGGDEEFKNKGLERMEEFMKSGTTVILVSHSLETIRKYCDKVLWLEEGEIKKKGNSGKIVNEYLEFIRKRKREKIKKREMGGKD